MLPLNPDKSAKKIRLIFEKEFDIKIGVIISDTFGRPFRSGQTDVAIGVSGIDPLLTYKGTTDYYKKNINVIILIIILKNIIKIIVIGYILYKLKFNF